MVEFPGRLLGIDHGLKYLGFATCDPTGLIATPLQVLERRSKREDFAIVNEIIAAQRSVAIVLGLPPRPPDFVGYSQADTVRNWAKHLWHAVHIPIYLWDEGFSSVDAEAALQSAGKRPPGRIDAHAAAVILQTFLDAIREGRPWPAPFSGGEPSES
ncbi:MAG: Holliday junction resolvase RuvX [Chloroflexi bacterium]|nr:Holliday junction resolvase RuvX [Chloroflexota bacterium]